MITPDWSGIIRELESMGYTTYRIGQILQRDHTTVEHWRDADTEPKYTDGAKLLKLHAKTFGDASLEPLHSP